MYGESDGSGIAVEGYADGTGEAGYFEVKGNTSTANALIINNAGTGAGVSATSVGTGVYASTSGTGAPVAIEGEATATNASNSTGVWGKCDETGAGGGIGVFGSNAGSGIGVWGTSVSGTGVNAQATGSGGNALIASYSGGATSSTNQNNIAIFENGTTHEARIDNTGKGYFDGGTVNSGADVAEAFDVPGARSSYEPGDVMVISLNGTRQVEKCYEPYSRLVAGVYATKPGVLLTPEHIDADLSNKIPLGVIGVIPTKVCAENGPIAAGDLLVTSSTPGHAMKADLSKLQIGEAIGKALDNFNGPGTGVIEVLVGKY